MLPFACVADFFFTCQKQLESNEIGCKPCDEHFALEKSLGVE